MIMRVGLTARQRIVLHAIVDFIETHDRSPSVRELAKATGVSAISSTQWLLDQLEERGYIDRHPGHACSIMVRARPAVDGSTPPLPPATQAALNDYCRLSGEDPAAVIADAVAAHLDELGPRVSNQEVARVHSGAPVELPG